MLRYSKFDSTSHVSVMDSKSEKTSQNETSDFKTDPKRRNLLIMLTRVRAALSVGGPLFQAGRMAQTVSVYQRAIRSMLSVDQREFLTSDVIETLEKSEEYVSHSSDVGENAWRLRQALDKVYDHYISVYCGLDGVGFLPVYKRISQAIDLGAPMYNAGRIEECMRLYLKIAKVLQEEKDLSTKAKEVLDKAIRSYEEDPNEFCSNAWALRKALDYVYDEVRLPEVYTSSEEVVDSITPFKDCVVTEDYLLDFSEQGKGLTFKVVVFNDSVMGGQSVSSFTTAQGPTKYGKFQGSVALSNRGGFASIRLVPLDSGKFREALKGCVGVLISVKNMCGNNVRYKLQLASETKMKAFNWQTDFIVREMDDFKHIYLHISSFWPTMFGHVLSNRGNIDLDKVDSIGLILSRLTEDGKENPDFQQGNFSLGIEWVKVLKKAGVVKE